MNTEINEYIKNNEKLIYSIISKFSGVCDKEDLYQVSTIGIIKAFKNYDKNSGTKLSTYIYKYIFGEVYDYVYKKNRSLKINSETLKLYKKVNDAKILLSQKLMKEPSIKELSIFLEIDENVLNSIVNSNMPIESLDSTVVRDGKELYLYDFVSSKDEINIENIYLKDEIDKLPEEEKNLLNMRYFEDRTQTEVADYFNMNQVQVSRIEKKVLKKLKDNMSSNYINM